MIQLIQTFLHPVKRLIIKLRLVNIICKLTIKVIYKVIDLQ